MRSLCSVVCSLAALLFVLAPLARAAERSGGLLDEEAVAKTIDHQLEVRLAEKAVPPAPLTEDAEFLRRERPYRREPALEIAVEIAARVALAAFVNALGAKRHKARAQRGSHFRLILPRLVAHVRAARSSRSVLQPPGSPR